MTTENIVLGSGKLYITDYNPSTGIPEDNVLEVAANRLGLIKGGASLEYTPEEYEIRDDLYEVNKRFVISEEATFKSGILTWDMATLKNIIAQGTYTDDTTNHTRTLKLGGNGAREMKKYVIRFVHDIDSTHKFRMTMVATASEGLTIAFNPDSESVIDASFKAVAHGNDGTQVILEEDYSA